MILFFFFFNDTATTEIYTLSLHDALPIYVGIGLHERAHECDPVSLLIRRSEVRILRSEEHTSELQSQSNLVCRLLLEKKKKNTKVTILPKGHQRISTSGQSVSPDRYCRAT